jgi:hypothetical protein
MTERKLHMHTLSCQTVMTDRDECEIRTLISDFEQTI